MLSASDAAQRAVHHVTAMTGRAAESVIGIEPVRPDGDDGRNGNGRERPRRNPKDGGGDERADSPEGGKAGTDGDGDGRPASGWRVIVEVVETRRIPDSADILAAYQAEVDGDGELVSYRRLRRYPRGRTGQD